MNALAKRLRLREWFGPNFIEEPRILRDGDYPVLPDFVFPAGILIEDKRSAQKRGNRVKMAKTEVVAYLAEGYASRPDLFGGEWLGVVWMHKTNELFSRTFRDGVPGSSWLATTPSNIANTVPGDLSSPIGPEWEKVRPDRWGHRLCYRCERIFPLEGFHIDRTDRNGRRRSGCKECVNTREREKRSARKLRETSSAGNLIYA